MHNRKVNTSLQHKHSAYGSEHIETRLLGEETTYGMPRRAHRLPKSRRTSERTKQTTQLTQAYKSILTYHTKRGLPVAHKHGLVSSLCPTPHLAVHSGLHTRHALGTTPFLQRTAPRTFIVRTHIVGVCFLVASTSGICFEFNRATNGDFHGLPTGPALGV